MAANITAEMLIAAALATLAVKYDLTADEIRSRIEGGDKAPKGKAKSSKAQQEPETADDGDETEEPEPAVEPDIYQQAVNGYVEKVRSLSSAGVKRRYLEALLDWSLSGSAIIAGNKIRVSGVDLEAVFTADDFDVVDFLKSVIAAASDGKKPAGRFNESRARTLLTELFGVDVSSESEEDDSGDKEPETPKHKAKKAETKTTKKVEAKTTKKVEAKADPIADALTSLGQKFIFWDVEGSASKKMFGILGENLNADVEKALLTLVEKGDFSDVIPVEGGKLALDAAGDLVIGEPCSGKTLRKLVKRFQG